MVEGNRIPAPAGLHCPNCGGNIELRGFAHTKSAVCLQCCSIIDPSTPQLTILQQFDEKMRVRPVMPLGSRGKWDGTLWEIIGFQQRTIYADGLAYSWHEYLLFNPYRGFRYFTLYNGHWNDVQTVHGLPTFTTSGGRKAVTYNGATCKHFQHAEAETTFVMGEFPWAVRVGERNTVDDYVAAPLMLSSEQSEGEINWSQGTYVDGKAIWQAFQLQGAPPQVTGVYANQPSPYAGKVRSSWNTFLVLSIAWAALLAFFVFTAGDKQVFQKSFRYAEATPGEHSFVTEPFDIPGKGNVEVLIRTDLENNWAYFNLALLREDGAKGYDFGREVSYYSGRDSDGSWSEGGKRESVILPAVDAGRYYLRIEPDMDPQASAKAASGMTMNYQVEVRRDVPRSLLFWLVLPLLIIPPIWTSIVAAAFEGKRWAESDYAPTASEDSDE